MTGSGEDVTKLFRALSPDDFNVQAAANAAAREAEQRWPLLKASVPQKLDLPPELSDQEKQRWGQQKKLSIDHRKPTLSMPTSSDKMALSLDKMSGRKVNVAPSRPETTTANRALPAAVSATSTNASTTAPAHARAPAVMKPDPVKPVVEAKMKQNLFFSAAKPAVQEEKPDNSLGGIFRRLAGKKDTEVAAMTPKGSLFGRLGKR